MAKQYEDTRKKTRLINLKVDEVSAVDVPANPGAQVSLLKRSAAEGEKTEHGHGGNAGVNSKEGVTGMSKTDVTVEELQKQLDTQAVEVATLKALASMTDAEKSYMAGLEGDAKAKFVSADAAGRKTMMGKAEETAKADNGNKSIELLTKRFEEVEKVNKHLAAENERHVLEKRAETELADLPMAMAEKVDLLRSLDTMEKAQSEKVLAGLKKAQEICKSFTQVTGVSTNQGVAGDASATLQKRVSDIAKNEGISETQAMRKFCATPEGSALYAQTQN